MVGNNAGLSHRKVRSANSSILNTVGQISVLIRGMASFQRTEVLLMLIHKLSCGIYPSDLNTEVSSFQGFEEFHCI